MAKSELYYRIIIILPINCKERYDCVIIRLLKVIPQILSKGRNVYCLSLQLVIVLVSNTGALLLDINTPL